MKPPHLLTVLALPVAVAVACVSSARLSPGDAVPYPEGYRDWTHVRSMLIEEGHPLYDSFGGIHHIYANDPALAGLRSGGAYEDGSVFVFDLLEAQSAGGAVLEGQRKVLGVMHRDAAAFGATGGWGFAGFGGDSRENVVADPRAGCFDCHTGRESSGYVFSEWRK